MTTEDFTTFEVVGIENAVRASRFLLSARVVFQVHFVTGEYYSWFFSMSQEGTEWMHVVLGEMLPAGTWRIVESA